MPLPACRLPVIQLPSFPTLPDHNQATAAQVPEVRQGVRCPTGESRMTTGAGLPARNVIHTVGPVYHNAEASAPLLESAYRSSLQLANQHGLKTVAFPAISCGIFGYPFDEAAEVRLLAVQPAQAAECSASL